MFEIFRPLPHHAVMKSLLLLFSLLFAVCGFAADEPKLAVLIVDGQNNHDWRKTTPVLKDALEKCGKFTVEVSTTPGEKGTAEDWTKWRPQFSKYKAVVSNYNGQPWPKEVKTAF